MDRNVPTKERFDPTTVAGRFGMFTTMFLKAVKEQVGNEEAMRAMPIRVPKVFIKALIRFVPAIVRDLQKIPDEQFRGLLAQLMLGMGRLLEPGADVLVVDYQKQAVGKGEREAMSLPSEPEQSKPATDVNSIPAKVQPEEKYDSFGGGRVELDVPGDHKDGAAVAELDIVSTYPAALDIKTEEVKHDDTPQKTDAA